MDSDLCDKLISSVYLNKEDKQFFLNNLNNENLFLSLLDLLADVEDNRYSNDPKIFAANYISQYNTEIIAKYEDRLLNLLNNIEEIGKIKDPIF